MLIIDADVILTVESLRRMTRHFAAEDVGAVTAYIKEGSRPENYLNRFVSFEYVTAQAAARRAQNVLGAQACLAGGAQLLTRASLEAVGGRIDTSTLAEDTATTFKVQLSGRRVVFDPTAVVWAEEPRDIGGLWKQRLRWGRGNVQITRAFRHVWLRRRNGKLGGIGFAAIWFSTTMMPVFMTLSSIGLLGLFVLDRHLSEHAFRLLLGVNVVTYLFITLSAISIDPATAKRTWREAILFPGVVSLLFIIYAAYPPVFNDLHPSTAVITAVALFAYAWQAGCMLVAAALKRLEAVPVLRSRGAAVAVRGRLRAAAGLDDRRGVWQGAARGRDALGEDREVRQDRRGAAMSDPVHHESVALESPERAELERREDQREERRRLLRQAALALVLALGLAARIIFVGN